MLGQKAPEIARCPLVLEKLTLGSDVPSEPTAQYSGRIRDGGPCGQFSDFIWLLVWAFVLGCYLVVLFQIVVDLFRDENLSGWWKAVWIIFLIIVPF